mgnify:FL=1
MEMIYRLQYRYTPQQIHAFCRVHLWYHRRQHPLFLKTPGLFLAGCLLWKTISLWREGTMPDIGQIVTLSLMGLFCAVLLWMGFVHPWVFERTLQQNLTQQTDDVKLEFGEDFVRATSGQLKQEYHYSQMESCYLTPGCIYLYVNSQQALLVPYDSLQKKDRAGFPHFLQQKLPGKIRVKSHL